MQRRLFEAIFMRRGSRDVPFFCSKSARRSHRVPRMRIVKIYIKMEEKSQVVEREAKKDEIHEKDGKSKR